MATNDGNSIFNEFNFHNADDDTQSARYTGETVNYSDLVSKIRYRDHAGSDQSRNEVVMFVDIRLFVMGVEVSNWLIGDVSVTRAKGSTDGTMSFTLDNNYDRFIIRPENLGGDTPGYDFNQDPSKGVPKINIPTGAKNRWIESSGNQKRGTFEYDEEAKKKLYAYKSPQTITGKNLKKSAGDTNTTSQTLPKFDLTIGACVIHLHDEVRAFVADPNHDPMNDADRRWMPLFSGVVSSAPVSRNRMTGESTITVSCSDVRYLMRKMRVATNIQSADQKKMMVAFDEPIGIFRDCIVLSAAEEGKVKFENSLSNYSYRQLTRALTCGDTIQDVQDGDAYNKNSGSTVDFMDLKHNVDPYVGKPKAHQGSSDATVSTGIGGFSIGLEIGFSPAKTVAQITDTVTLAAEQSSEHKQALVTAIVKLQTDVASISDYLNNTAATDPLSSAINRALAVANTITTATADNHDNFTVTVLDQQISSLQSIVSEISKLFPSVQSQLSASAQKAKKVAATESATDTSSTSTSAGQTKEKANANKAADVLPTDVQNVSDLATKVKDEASSTLNKQTIASDASTQRTANISTLEDWNDMVVFGAKRDWYTDWEVDVIGSNTRPIMYLTESAESNVDADKASPSPHSVLNGFVHYLMPDKVTGALGIRNAIEQALVTPGTDVNWTNRLDALAQASETIDYQFYVTPMGDIAFEFPMYDFDPTLFGKFAACYVVRDSIKSDEHNDEGDGNVVTGLVVRGAYQSAEKGSNTPMSDTAQDQAYSYIVKSDFMAEKYGPVVEEYSIPWHHKVWADGKEDDAREKNSLITFGIIEFYRRIAAMSSMGFSGCYNPFLLPNRPVLNLLQRRMALTTSCQLSIPIGGAPSSSVDTYFVRKADQDGKFISITGQSNTPFSYGNADYLDLFTNTDLANIRTPYGIELIDPRSSMVQEIDKQLTSSQLGVNTSFDNYSTNSTYDANKKKWNTLQQSNPKLAAAITNAAKNSRNMDPMVLYTIMNHESSMNAKAYNGAGGVGHYGVIQISATNLLKMNVDPNTFYQKYPTVESQLSLVSQYYRMITKQDLSNPVKALAATFCPASLTNGEGPSTVLSAKAQAANPGFVTMNDYSKASGYDCSVGSTNSSTTAALPVSTTTTGLQVTLNTSKSASDNTTTHTTGSHK